jgi:hypothetical protein
MQREEVGLGNGVAATYASCQCSANGTKKPSLKPHEIRSVQGKIYLFIIIIIIFYFETDIAKVVVIYGVK